MFALEGLADELAKAARVADVWSGLQRSQLLEAHTPARDDLGRCHSRSRFCRLLLPGSSSPLNHPVSCDDLLVE